MSASTRDARLTRLRPTASCGCTWRPSWCAGSQPSALRHDRPHVDRRRLACVGALRAVAQAAMDRAARPRRCLRALRHHGELRYHLRQRPRVAAAAGLGSGARPTPTCASWTTARSRSRPGTVGTIFMRAACGRADVALSGRVAVALHAGRLPDRRRPWLARLGTATSTWPIAARTWSSPAANVFPAEVEAAISEHPGVADVAVIGLPDDEYGETVHAILQPSVEAVDVDTAFCASA